MKNVVYQEVTADEYELIIHQADSARELSRICGLRSEIIEQACKRYPCKGKKRRFIKLKLEGD